MSPFEADIGYIPRLPLDLLPVGYANVSGVTEATTNSREFQHPYDGPFKHLKEVGENAFLLDIPACWRLHLVFNVARLKLSRGDKTRSHLAPPCPGVRD